VGGKKAPFILEGGRAGDEGVSRDDDGNEPMAPPSFICGRITALTLYAHLSPFEWERSTLAFLAAQPSR
jgi:hypothetical protein